MFTQTQPFQQVQMIPPFNSRPECTK